MENHYYSREGCMFYELNGKVKIYGYLIFVTNILAIMSTVNVAHLVHTELGIRRKKNFQACNIVFESLFIEWVIQRGF